MNLLLFSNQRSDVRVAIGKGRAHVLELCTNEPPRMILTFASGLRNAPIASVSTHPQQAMGTCC